MSHPTNTNEECYNDLTQNTHLFNCFATVLSIEIRVQQDWDDSLKDKNSQKFKDLAKLMSEQVNVSQNWFSFSYLVRPISHKIKSVLATKWLYMYCCIVYGSGHSTCLDWFRRMSILL